MTGHPSLSSRRAAHAWGVLALSCALILPVGVLFSSLGTLAGSSRFLECSDRVVQGRAGSVVLKSAHDDDVAWRNRGCHGAAERSFAP
jgi:hypothetical protein